MNLYVILSFFLLLILPGCGPTESSLYNITDQSKLARIAMTARDPQVRIAATWQITDRDLNARLAVTAKDGAVRVVATGKLTDQSVLSTIALKDEDSAVVGMAVKRLSDQSTLVKVAMHVTDDSNRKLAVDKVSDQNMLSKLALEAKDAKVRQCAIGRIANQDLVATVAQNDTDAGVRCAAARRLTDQRVLAAIVGTDTNARVRSAACKLLDDLTLLSAIANTDSDRNVRTIASEKLAHQAELAKQVKSAREVDRLLAVRELVDQNLLANLAINDPWSNVRFAALDRISDPVQLRRVAEDAADPSVHSRACERITDQAVLLALATTARNASVRRIAVARLSDRAQLSGIAVSDDDDRIRLDVVSRLSDHKVLAQLAETDKNASVRRAAIREIVDQSVLSRIVGQDKDDAVRSAAASKLTDHQVLVQVATHDASVDVRFVAAIQLTRTGGTISPLVTFLKDRHKQKQAADVLDEVNYTPTIEDEKIAYWIAKKRWEDLAKLGTPAIPALLNLLDNGDPILALHAIELLGEIRDARVISPLIKCIRSFDLARQDAAAKALGRQGSAAVIPLIECLTCEWTTPIMISTEPFQQNARRGVASALGAIGDKRAIGPLRVALPDWDANMEIVEALNALGWDPGTDEDRVYIMIANKDGKGLRTSWALTKQVLFADVKSGCQRKAENAIYALLSLGEEQVIKELIRFLGVEGNKVMAETYLNCGHEELDKAARTWCARRGYNIKSGNGARKARWAQW